MAAGTGSALPLIVGYALVAVACGGNEEDVDPDTIVIGAALPFTGEDATIGQNLEQALLLAVEDVNRAGGIAGRRLRVESRDSNSGSRRGLDGLLGLLYKDGVKYLVGPEENELADEIVPDIKGLDVFNVLPGYASPSIERYGHDGAWIRLPPSALAFGCGLSEIARQEEVELANTIVALDDYNQSVASEFTTEFVGIGGEILPQTTVRAGARSYIDRTEKVLGAGADRTLLIVNPTTAARIVTELAVEGLDGDWLLGPMLHTPGFVQNLPYGSLDGTHVLSPTLSLASECENKPTDYRGHLDCGRDNAEAFSAHFARRWSGDRPFPAAYFYYDGVVLLAMALNYVAASGDLDPRADDLHSGLLEMIEDASEWGRWDDLGAVMDEVSGGTPVAYAGAAAEYHFDKHGAAIHLVFDSWRIERQEYVDDGALQARCLRQPK
ncbi:MAG: ABC transporter substrate-binding protein [Polyangiaceae bacterium]|nr:ABC transporter substrate-binding protein [Polyangiaceae bacterium]